MAAKRAVLNNREVLLFTGAKKDMKRSRGNWVKKVDNVPGLEKYKRTIVELRDDVLSDLVKGPFKHNLFVIKDSVASIKKQDKVFTLRDKTGRTYRARHVVLATGIMDEQPQIKGSIRPILSYANKQTIAYCLMCDGHRSYKKKTVVLGHSEDAAKAALLIADRYEPLKVTILTNGKKPEFSSETQSLLLSKKIDVVDEPIKKILGAKKGVLSGFELKSSKQVAASIGFVFLGIRPNNSLALELGAKCDSRGLVITDESGESSIPDLFVVGDLRANSMKQIYAAWQHAVDSMVVIDKRIRTEE
jgi:thioredoxin reductase (NADPH)